MNLTNVTCPISIDDVYNSSRVFADAWVSSLELRVATFVLVMQCCIMLWVTCLVREVMRTATTVLCKLLVYDCAASVAPGNRTLGSYGQASVPCTRHKTDGGPPPVPHPEDVQSGS